MKASVLVPKSVVISSYTFLPEIGGVATTVAYLATGFADLGFTTTVATLTDTTSDESFPFRVVRRPSIPRLMRLYARADYVLLSNLSLRLGLPALLVGKRYGLSHHSESSLALTQDSSTGSSLRRLIRDRAAMHFVTSDFVGQRSGLAQRRTVRPFANPRYITADTRAPYESRRDALFVGRLVEEKGVLELVQRWSELRRVLDVDSLRLVGSGALHSSLHNGIADGSVRNVRMLGSLSLAETASEMGKARYLIVPSVWEEPFGAVALEGLAAGAVVISSCRGGLSEATGSLSFLYDPSDPDGLLSAAEAARDRFDELARSQTAASEYITQVDGWCAKFSPRAAAATIIDSLDDA